MLVGGYEEVGDFAARLRKAKDAESMERLLREINETLQKFEDVLGRFNGNPSAEAEMNIRHYRAENESLKSKESRQEEEIGTLRLEINNQKKETQKIGKRLGALESKNGALKEENSRLTSALEAKKAELRSDKTRPHVATSPYVATRRRKSRKMVTRDAPSGRSRCGYEKTEITQIRSDHLFTRALDDSRGFFVHMSATGMKRAEFSKLKTKEILMVLPSGDPPRKGTAWPAKRAKLP